MIGCNALCLGHDLFPVWMFCQISLCIHTPVFVLIEDYLVISMSSGLTIVCSNSVFPFFFHFQLDWR